MDHRSDIFAVGAVLYELLTYRQAFPGDLQTGILHKIMHGSPTPLREVTPDTDPAIAAVVDRALEKEPEARYQDLEAMRVELEAIRRRIDGSGRPPTVPGTDWSKLSSLRAEQVGKQLKTAEDAFAGGDFQAAMAACEQALLFDTSDSRITRLIDAIRKREHEQQAAKWLDEAQQHFDLGEITVAVDLVDRAANVLPDDPRIEALRLEGKKIQQDREAQREHDSKLQTVLADARAALNKGDIAACLADVATALTLDPGNAEATAIKQHAAIKSAVIEATGAFEAGRLAEADLHAGSAMRLAPNDTSVRVLRRRVNEAIHLAVLQAAASARR